jgi:hypothetical protein
MEMENEDNGHQEVKIPTKEELLTLFKSSPDDCTPEEQQCISFFYNVGLATVNKTIRNKTLMQGRDVWAVLGKPTPQNWASAMAYALTLVEKMSDLENIVHNYKNETKKKKKKTLKKEALGQMAVSFYVNNDLFTKMRFNVGNKDELKATRICFANWERKVGVMGSNEPSAAQKRASVEPLSRLNNNKLPKLGDINIDYAKRKEMTSVFDLDDDEDDEFLLQFTSSLTARI